MNGVTSANRIAPDWPAPERVGSLVTTRAGGVSTGPYASLNLGARTGDDAGAVQRNRALLRNLVPAEPAWLHQVHGTRVIDACAEPADVEADGAIARSPGAVCAVLTADCIPVLLCDRGGGAVGIAHAGWRGLAAGIIESVLSAMGTDPQQTLAWLGPGIGPDAYEVGQDVFDAFVTADGGAAQAFSECGTGRYRANLYVLARQRLEKSGVSAVYGGAFCTYRDRDRFFSYRRDGETGRIASLVWLK